MPTKSESVIEALDRMRVALAKRMRAGSPEFGNDSDSPGDAADPFGLFDPYLRNGPSEHVLAFNNDEKIYLVFPPEAGRLDDILDSGPQGLANLTPDQWPYFSSRGPLTDLFGNVLRASWVETSFPVNPASLGETERWPYPQERPYYQPPVKEDLTTGHGYSKQAYYLNEDDWFVTVGPSLPKIARLGNGGAQFWVGSIGVISKGGGRYKGVRGVTTYVGSGYLKEWPPPEQFSDQLEILTSGFRALIGTYVKVVFEDDLAGSRGGRD